MRDIYSDNAKSVGLPPAARTNGTATGTAVDIRQARGAVVEFNIGAWTDGTHTPSVEDSPDGTTYTAVPSSNLKGALAAVSGTAGQNAIQRVGYMGSGGFVRQKIVTASSTTGAIMGGSVRRGLLVGPTS